MVNSFNESFEKGELSTSQKQAVITLLQKPGKDRLLLSNWRPISLLNLDYKILTKTICQRIQDILPDIIHENQSGFVSNRKLEFTVRTIQDLMYYSDENDLLSYFLFVDFEKAFDLLEWNIIVKSLEKFNFGQDSIKWIQTFYNNISSCIINNGHTCQYFQIGRGVRQGDPLSPYLFIICIELLSIAIRQNDQIKGIKIAENEIKLLQFADDLTCSLMDIKSGGELFKLFNRFESCSGLRVNKTKTEGLWLGKNKGNSEIPFDIAWPKTPIRILGVYVGHETTEVEKANFEKPLLSLKQTLNAWKGRCLSLKGKVLIAKTLGLSKFLFLSKVMHVPILIKNEIDWLIYNFIWNGNTDKVRRNIFMQKICNGGYNMHDFNTVDKSLKIMWMKYLLDENNNMWKGYILEVLGKENINILFRSKYTEYMVPSFSKLPLFYKEVFTHWKFVKI